MVITGALIADNAYERDGKLYVEGGGWLYVMPPVPTPKLVLLFDSSTDDIGQQFEIILSVKGPDGNGGDFVRAPFALESLVKFAVLDFDFPYGPPGRYVYSARLAGIDQLPFEFSLDVVQPV